MRLFLAAPLVALSVLRAPGPTPFIFATIDRPIGVAVTASRVFSTQECSFQITGFAPDGTSSLFATLPSWGQRCTERYIAVPPAWFGGDLFATQGRIAFRISGGTAGQKVCWQVSGVRRDAWANANPLVLEEQKAADVQGLFLCPDAFGEPPEKSLGQAFEPALVRRIRRTRQP